MKFFADKEILQVLSGLFTDLGAGWLALIVIGQTYGNIDSIWQLLIFLTVNITGATLSLVLAIILAKIAKRYE